VFRRLNEHARAPADLMSRAARARGSRRPQGSRYATRSGANHGSPGSSLVISSRNRNVTTSEARGCEIDASPSRAGAAACLVGRGSPCGGRLAERSPVARAVSSSHSEARRKLAQAADLVALERQVVLQEVLVSGRQRRDPQVGNAVREVICGVRQPRVGERSHPRSSSWAEDLGDPVGPACEQLGREPRLECLHRSACLQPGDAVAERHAQHRRSGSSCVAQCTDRFDVRASPVFGGAVHAPTMPPRCMPGA
jgi:hypothetical protein